MSPETVPNVALCGQQISPRCRELLLVHSAQPTASCHTHAIAGAYERHCPETTALYQVLQQHLLTFEQQWTDAASGRTLPKFVLDELHGFVACGILGRGLAHVYCEACREHHVVAVSCKARAVCPSCLGRSMSEGAAELVDRHWTTPSSGRCPCNRPPRNRITLRMRVRRTRFRSHQQDPPLLPRRRRAR